MNDTSDLRKLQEELLDGARDPDVMSSECYGGGGGTQSAAPGCSDIADVDEVAD